MSGVSPERLRRFFTRSDSGYQVNRNVREMCVFSRHVLGIDPPLSRMDLISCRNLLIYFAAALQQRVIETLAYAIRPRVICLSDVRRTRAGCLSSSTPVDDAHRLYARRPNVEARALSLVAHVPVRREASTAPSGKPRAGRSSNQGRRSLHGRPHAALTLWPQWHRG